MRKITKILLGLLLLTILIGSVYASDYDNFKPAYSFTDFKSGESICTADSSIRMVVSNFDADEFVSDEFFDVTLLDNNIYKCYDKDFKDTFPIEKISVNGTDYMVIVSGNADFDTLMGLMEQFNQRNNVEPIAV